MSHHHWYHYYHSCHFYCYYHFYHHRYHHICYCPSIIIYTYFITIIITTIKISIPINIMTIIYIIITADGATESFIVNNGLMTSKLKRLVEELRRLQTSDATAKCLVFSQFSQVCWSCTCHPVHYLAVMCVCNIVKWMENWNLWFFYPSFSLYLYIYLNIFIYIYL